MPCEAHRFDQGENCPDCWSNRYSDPNVITFESGGKTHAAVISLALLKPPASDQLVTIGPDGTRYAISIAFGSIPGYPDIGFIARPIKIR